MDGRRLFEANLDVIERAITLVCRHVRLQGADAEDFASSARVALLDDDCAILQQHQGQSSLLGYVAVVVRRLFFDQKRAGRRWYPSAEATRRGPATVMLERLLVRDRKSVAEAVADTKAQHPQADERELEASVAALPDRAPRAEFVQGMDFEQENVAGGRPADDRVRDLELQQTCTLASQAVTAALDAMTAQDRVILRLRFGKGAAISDIAWA